MFRLIVLAAALSACMAAPGFYANEAYLGGSLGAGPAVVSGHPLQSPVVKGFAQSPLYGDYPGVVKAAPVIPTVVKTVPVVPTVVKSFPLAPGVVAPAAGFVKAPVFPSPYALDQGHVGHVAPYLH